MKYVIRCPGLSKRKLFYASEQSMHSLTPVLPDAEIFDLYDSARDVVIRLPSAAFAYIVEVSDKELFEAKLKGI